jgi:hypothetical protein
MRLILTILFTLFCLNCFCQKMQVYSLAGGSTAAWTTGDESSVMNYEVQDSVTKWVAYAEVPKGQSSYTFLLPSFSAWWRIRAVGVSDFYTDSIYVSVDNVSITYPTFHTTSLTWITSNEINVSYYLIQKTRNGITTQVTKYPAKGSGNYKYYMSRTIYKYVYKITPFFKDGTSKPPINFQ